MGWSRELKKVTTGMLLEELAMRMDLTQNSIKGRELAVLCREALEKLDWGVLSVQGQDK